MYTTSSRGVKRGLDEKVRRGDSLGTDIGYLVCTGNWDEERKRVKTRKSILRNYDLEVDGFRMSKKFRYEYGGEDTSDGPKGMTKEKT